MITFAAIQMNSTSHVAENLQHTKKLIKRAVAQKAKLIVLPENFAYIGNTVTPVLQQVRDELAEAPSLLMIAETYGVGPIQDFLKSVAKEYQIYLVGGTIPLTTPNDNKTLPQKIYSSSLLYDPDGNCIARYDKIHLFDVCVNEKEQYLESKVFQSGKEIVVANTAIGNIGLSVCYDLRFPELYRQMLEKNVEIITVPSAFTYTTGKAHWEVLVRARAIENLCYVIAPNQVGIHSNDRQTYGHSMIVNHWGQALAQKNKGEGVVTAKFDKIELARRRQTFPVLTHRKCY